MYFIYLQFFLGFVILIKGADLLVDGGSALAKRLRISDFIVGLTIISFGTSAPELFVNVVASWSGSPALALGNIIGSNVANILLILGIASLVAPLAVASRTIKQEIPMTLLATMVLIILVNDQFLGSSQTGVETELLAGSIYNYLTRGDALILLIFFALFMCYVYFQARTETDLVEAHDAPFWKAILYVLIGLVGLSVGGDWIVKGATHLSRSFGLSEAVIGITIVGVGTSLPEVAASAVAAYRDKADIAVANALGSNLFNILWVLGISAFILPIPFDSSLNLDMAIMVFVLLLLYSVLFIGKRHQLSRAKGLVFLLFYVTYIIFLLVPSSKQSL